MHTICVRTIQIVKLAVVLIGVQLFFNDRCFIATETFSTVQAAGYLDHLLTF